MRSDLVKGFDKARIEVCFGLQVKSKGDSDFEKPFWYCEFIH